jgi:hypothetical protein
LGTFQMFCCNLPRQRRIMCNYFGDFETLLNLALVADQQLHSISSRQYAFSAPSIFKEWTFRYAISSIVRIIRLGFDLELYDEDEYLSICWYLSKLTSGQFPWSARTRMAGVIYAPPSGKFDLFIILMIDVSWLEMIIHSDSFLEKIG